MLTEFVSEVVPDTADAFPKVYRWMWHEIRDVLGPKVKTSWDVFDWGKTYIVTWLYNGKSHRLIVRNARTAFDLNAMPEKEKVLRAKIMKLVEGS